MGNISDFGIAGMTKSRGGERSAVGPLTKLLLSNTPEQSQQNEHSGFYLGLFIIDCARFCDFIILAELFA